MTSNAIKGIRRKKSTLSEVKIAIVGAPGVGKSALTVRFITKRYIGEYDHQSDLRYKHEAMVDGDAIIFDLLDSCPKTLDEVPSSETLNWADGLVLVYAITDRNSINYIKRVKLMLGSIDLPTVLIANKGDLIHLRQISTEEGENLARSFDCWFKEVTAAEQVSQIADVFHELCREILQIRKKNKQSLLDRMLGGKTVVRTYARGKSDSALPKERNND
ncbi:unnamed protein product [Bemisia tabaci]|uniref:small monomeric GTPase n=1 Tax=Bemisia tabaci TaxID=7038 RepID=A0A9P0A9V9_BEMTA|nr:PREDICTED: ras-related and estrogen-regulated growth inhibitor [Bemisia tabaci]CAH0386368.1 unnamed protein product [Bemisia tabaci]